MIQKCFSIAALEWDTYGACGLMNEAKITKVALRFSWMVTLSLRDKTFFTNMLLLLYSPHLGFTCRIQQRSQSNLFKNWPERRAVHSTKRQRWLAGYAKSCIVMNEFEQLTSKRVFMAVEASVRYWWLQNFYQKAVSILVYTHKSSMIFLAKTIL